MVNTEAILGFIELNLLFFIDSDNFRVWLPSSFVVLIDLNDMLFTSLLMFLQKLNSEQDDVAQVVRSIQRKSQSRWKGIDPFMLQVEWLVGVIWVLHI